MGRGERPIWCVLHATTPTHKRMRKALTACKRPVSGTISLPSRGTFHHSLTVLSTIGHQEVFRQPSGLGRFTQDSTSPVLLGHHPRHTPTSSAYGGITHYATPSQTIQLPASHAPGLRQKTTGQPHNPAHATPAEYHTHTVSPSSAFARHYSRNIFSYGY